MTIPDQVGRILQAFDRQEANVNVFMKEVRDELGKVRDALGTSLAQDRADAVRSADDKEAQALINTKVRNDHTYLKEKVQGDGTKGLEEKGRDMVRDIEKLGERIDDIIIQLRIFSEASDKQTTAWNRLTVAIVALALTIIGALFLKLI